MEKLRTSMKDFFELHDIVHVFNRFMELCERSVKKLSVYSVKSCISGFIILIVYSITPFLSKIKFAFFTQHNFKNLYQCYVAQFELHNVAPTVFVKSSDPFVAELPARC